jgi:hypothetical protein
MQNLSYNFSLKTQPCILVEGSRESKTKRARQLLSTKKRKEKERNVENRGLARVSFQVLRDSDEKREE